ncbi:hypothetical protein Q2941_05630 [Bradyrhizobium sp. UFLA05-153]
MVNDDADELSRPDRSHVVIDVMPDFITLQDNTTCELQNIQVVQIWCDPNYPDAHRDPALRRWLFRRAEEGIAALVRFNAKEALTIFAPPFDENGEWHESSGASTGRTHSLLETIKALSGRASNDGSGQ